MVGIFFYTLLVLELASVSIELSEYRVLCLNAVKQVLICRLDRRSCRFRVGTHKIHQILVVYFTSFFLMLMPGLNLHGLLVWKKFS